MDKVQIGSCTLGAEDVLAVCVAGAPLVVDAAALDKVRGRAARARGAAGGRCSLGQPRQQLLRARVRAAPTAARAVP